MKRQAAAGLELGVAHAERVSSRPVVTSPRSEATCVCAVPEAGSFLG